MNIKSSAHLLEKIIGFRRGNRIMGNEGWGVTVFVTFLIFSPIIFIIFGLSGLVIIFVFIIYILLRHEVEKNNNPGYINKHYDYSKKEVFNRELTIEEKIHLKDRELFLEIANRQKLKNKRPFYTKNDFHVAMMVNKPNIYQFDDLGIYYINKKDKIYEYIYIIKFTPDIVCQEPRYGTCRRHPYVNRFLYEKEIN